MSKYLLIVESPKKSKTIEGYLGSEYKVLSSYGHINAIPSKSGMVDTETFEAQFELTPSGQRQIKEILKYAKASDCECVYLCTDPDREGEAISWHVYNELVKRGVKKEKFKRATYNEISKRAIVEALKNARDIDMNMVDAQRARQNLDYLVGFNLSPLLWSKVARGTSAGRVQSPALRLIDERESEIKVFKPEEYWQLFASLFADEISVKARMTHYNKTKLEKMSIQDVAKAKEILTELGDGKISETEEDSKGQTKLHLKTKLGKAFKVCFTETKERKRKPKPPFKTSTLQQDGSNRYGFSAKRTMQAAQHLFERGLITYMRTDSQTLSDEALTDIRKTIKSLYGEKEVHSSIRVYENKSKNAQEAHEAIRPTDPSLTPSEAAKMLESDEEKLYELIWNRTIACQMNDALIDATTIDFAYKDHIFRATGQVITYPGFLIVYQEAKGVDDEDDAQVLPKLSEGDEVKALEALADQSYTQPPPRYSEATLIKTLEDYGIGRPSTYASIISTLNDRNYIELNQRRFNATDIGHLVATYLYERFPTYLSYDFTAKMEEDLDKIARGEKNYLDVIKAFWKNFHELVEKEKKAGGNHHVTGVVEVLDEVCPQCGENHLAVRMNTKGNKFVTCTGYPECKYSRPIYLDKNCPECGSPLVERMIGKGKNKGKKFVGCSAHPKCNYIEGRVKPKDTGRICPQCKKHNLVERVNKKNGNTFTACSGFPKCRHIES